TRADLVPALKDEGRGRSGSGSLRRAFVAAQVGLSLVLLVSASLLVRSLQRASEVQTGFDPTGAWLSGVDLAMEGYGPDEGAVLQRRLLESVSGLPGVTSAALAIDLPLDLGSHGTVAYPEGWSGAEGRDYVGVGFNHVTPEYFATLAIPVLEGRDFAPEEGPGTAPVVAVSRTFADRIWPEGSALGRRLRVSLPEVEEEWRTVVAVVEDVKNQMLTDAAEPFVYLPLWQAYRPDTRVVVRFRTEEPAGVTAQMRGAILAVDGSLSVEPVISLARVTSLGTLPQRVAASVTSVLGLLALLLAALGVYGVVAFAVTRRTREIGVRMALGAGRAAVVRLVLRDGLLLALPGLLVGAVGAAGVGYLLRFLLLGLSPADPVALAGVTATLVGVVVAASLIPGRRAACIEPVEALRSE
ncbi:MAG TPA: FtsX-like permease family protein, partial [Longimicrobiales bacterium]|nr:FtsX-like permease family protein [Longimicrobiales bacterium]